jgi:hypothetical protein
MLLARENHGLTRRTFARPSARKGPLTGEAPRHSMSAAASAARLSGAQIVPPSEALLA